LHPFVVYRASAGSGKTFTLTRDFVARLLAQEQPTAYLSQLALTFTKKATEEMKTRILKWLDALSLPLGSPEGDEAREQCLQLDILQTLDAPTLQKRALRLRETILHDYGRLSVFTIDAFFQRMVRAFIWEAGLPSGYSVDFDDERLLQEALDQVVDEIPEHSVNREWMKQILVQRIQDGGSWDVQKAFSKIAREVLREEFSALDQESIDKISDKDFLQGFMQQLRKACKEFETRIQQSLEQLQAVLDAYELSPKMFKRINNSFVQQLFRKLRKDGKEGYEFPSVARDAINKPNDWTTTPRASDLQKKAENERINKAYEEINPLLKDLRDYYDAHFPEYLSIQATLAQLPQMAMLGDIRRHLSQLLNENHAIHLSQTLALLQKLVRGSDAPFILEKMGVRYRNFLLDEFQDTSRAQWEVLKPLLHNGLSEEGGSALLVGDVKQAIYRWRNSDWRILQDGLNQAFPSAQAHVENLLYNWRSDKLLIDSLGNIFLAMQVKAKEVYLEKMSEELGSSVVYEEKAAEISRVYEDVVQQAPPHKEEGRGYLCIQNIEPDGGQSAHVQALALLPQRIMELQDRGFKASDIAILVRKNAEGQKIAAALVQYEQQYQQQCSQQQQPSQTLQQTKSFKYCFKVISSDSFFLYRIPEVNLIMALFKESVAPDDQINAELISRLASELGLSLPDKEWRRAKVDNYALSEAFERTVDMLGFHQSGHNLAFVQELHQQLLSYVKGNNSPDAYSFVRWWEQHKHKIPLPLEHSGEAIHIVTIHKSKGLEYPVVLIPFCDWVLDHPPRQAPLLWVQAQQAPLNELPCLLQAYKKEMAKGLFAEAYMQEKAQIMVDELNLFYVAATRARHELHIFLTQKDGQMHMARFLKSMLELGNEGEAAMKTYGLPCENFCQKEGSRSDAETVLCESYPCQPHQLHLRLHIDEAFPDPGELPSPRQRGIILHKALSSIQTEADIAPVLSDLAAQGLLSSRPQEQQNYIAILQTFLRRPDIAPWFDGTWTVRNEASILLPVGAKKTQLRPDRVIEKDGRVVVIDYKFGAPRPEHQKQIDAYVQVLKDMGHRQVEGKLIYIYP
jgi:ATP-dependent exoDNAse (exonuclease V) beta subunit (contains helicase and exonuclease domains)